MLFNVFRNRLKAFAAVVVLLTLMGKASADMLMTLVGSANSSVVQFTLSGTSVVNASLQVLDGFTFGINDGFDPFPMSFSGGNTGIFPIASGGGQIMNRTTLEVMPINAIILQDSRLFGSERFGVGTGSYSAELGDEFEWSGLGTIDIDRPGRHFTFDDLRGGFGLGKSAHQVTGSLAVDPYWHWGIPDSGSWTDIVNWDLVGMQFPQKPPNSYSAIVNFSDVLDAPCSIFGPCPIPDETSTVTVDSTVTARELHFDSEFPYILAGAGTIILDANSSAGRIEVQSGNHEIQVPLSLADNVSVSAALGAVLNVSMPTLLNGHTFNITGDGTILLENGAIAAGNGINVGAVINEGNLAGLSIVEGNLTQTKEGSLRATVGESPIQIGGAAVLDGTLYISLASGFLPIPGHSYALLTADTILNLGVSLSGPAADQFRLAVDGNSLNLIAVTPGNGLLGDYNNDGTVNAADYTVYRNRKAGIGGTTLPNDAGALGVTIDDYNYWKAHFGESLGSGPSLFDGATDVPEPAAICQTGLAALLLAAMSGRRLRRQR
jgi:hypothetical protein